jgi:methionyl-tRNA formyltransferase
VRVLFFGTSEFAAKILSKLLKHKINVVGIVTRTDKPQGRSLKVLPPPVKQVATQMAPQIPILQPIKASTPEFAAHLKTLSPDLFIVAAYGEILKQIILDLPSLGAINVHASLLPKLRGAAPIQRCLMKGDAETGVTIMKMVLEMDAGDILAQKEVPLTLDTTCGELEDNLAEIGSSLLLDVLQKLHLGTLRATPQNHTQATYAAKLSSNETFLDFNRSAFEVHNQIRALSPEPGAWCFVETNGQKKKLKIRRSRIADLEGYAGETLAFDDTRWVVGCKKGSVELLEVQLEGKKSLPIEEFLRGRPEPCKILD